MTHDLKILPEYFTAVRDGIKAFEVRKDDRPFEVGDILCLHEINCGVLTGRTIKAEVTYVLRHPDYCKEGYCILSIKVAQQQTVKPHEKGDRSIVAASNVLAKDALAVDTLCKQILEYKRLLKTAIGDNKRVLRENFGDICQFCKHYSNSEAQCRKPHNGSGSWCCENAEWRYADEALKLIGGIRYENRQILHTLDLL